MASPDGAGQCLDEQRDHADVPVFLRSAPAPVHHRSHRSRQAARKGTVSFVLIMTFVAVLVGLVVALDLGLGG